MDAVLETRSLCKSFGALTVANAVDFRLERGARHALIGPNGAGKTTAFNLVSGLFPPDAGTIELEGRSIAGLKPEDITDAEMQQFYKAHSDEYNKPEEVRVSAVIVKSGNMSLGVNLLAALVKRVAQTLDPSFDIEILEMHHKGKIDAPSGTALMLGEAAAAGRKLKLDKQSARGRDGVTGARRTGDIGFASLRGGTAAGDHSVIFAGPSERLTLSHLAEDRMLFAHGVLKAALWAHGRKPGLYTMIDVLGVA